MGRYILRRLLISIPILLGVTIVTFTFANLAPGDPISALMKPGVDLRPEAIEQLKAALGLDKPFHVVGADVALGRGDEHVLRLTQWLEPFDPEPANPAAINRIGIQRIALLVTDVDRAVAILKREGVPFLSEIAPCCSGTGADETGIVHAIDPDGVYLELVGHIARRPLQPQPQGCPPLEIKMPPAG